LVAGDSGTLQKLKVFAVGATEAVLAAPVFGAVGDGLIQTGGEACAVGRMNAFLPEAKIACVVRAGITEQAFEALRPGELSATQIPIPNCIVRSPGKDLKIIRARRRAAFMYGVIRVMMDSGVIMSDSSPIASARLHYSF
jgi:hypothetical protein